MSAPAPTSGKSLPTTTFLTAQPLNAYRPMLVTLFGIVRLVNPLQPANAEYPMLVTPSGIVRLVSPLQPQNT